MQLNLLISASYDRVESVDTNYEFAFLFAVQFQWPNASRQNLSRSSTSQSAELAAAHKLSLSINRWVNVIEQHCRIQFLLMTILIAHFNYNFLAAH